MKDRRKIIYVFVLLSSVSIISIAGGLLALYSATLGSSFPNVYVGNFDMGGLTKQEAENKLKDSYSNNLKDGSFIVNYKINDVKNEFKIMYSDIDATVDYGSTVDKIFGENGEESFKTLINGCFLGKKRTISPDVLVNNGKLVGKLKELSAIINKDPKDANIYLLEDKITKEPEEFGLKLNIENAAKKIKDEIGTHFNSPIEFKAADDFEITVEKPQMTMEKLKDAEEVISTYTTEIKSSNAEKSVKLAAKAINKVWVPGSAIGGKNPEEFSFNKLLSIANCIDEQNNEGYNQVASTLFAAILMAGIENSGITRTPHKTPTDYIEPGLDAVVFGSTVDFKFKNTLDGAIVIFTSVKDNKLTVSLVGKKKDKLLKNSLKVEIEQKFSPSIVNVENQDLPSGQKKVISEGKEGLKVNIYRVTTKDGAEVKREFLYNDKYSAQDEIVQVSTGSKIGNENTK